ncbi:MAG: M1 family metallopeptidase [Chloroflexota bacterium]|nr:M1 family metallopeptidase [Chloroflexota bacterium]
MSRGDTGTSGGERAARQTWLIILGLFILFGFLIVSAWRLARPRRSPSPPATPSPPPVASPSPVPSRTAVPTGTPTRPPITPAPDYGQGLRPEFREDVDRFPEATRYDLELTIDLDEAMVYGHEGVAYTNTETVPLESLILRLFPNTPGYGGTMTVTHLAIDGRSVEPVSELGRGALRVPLEAALPPRAGVDVTLDFTLALPTDQHPADSREPGGGYRQLGIYDDTVALANAYPLVPVYNDEGWNVELAPIHGDAVFSDVAFFNVSITAPQTMTLAASGTCTVFPADGGQNTWSCTAAPMRDFNAVLGGYYQVESDEVMGVTVNSVFYTGHEEGGARALDYASAALWLFDERIGAYPFSELDVVETPTLAGGIEYPGLVVINSAYYGDGGSRMEWVVVHEVLHQWWYSLVGNDQVDKPWLDEALTQYCTLLYFEERYGEEMAERLLESMFQEPTQQLEESGRDKPAGLPVAAYSGSDYGLVVYQKGPLYFHELRQEVGGRAFWEILQTYFEQNRYLIATPTDWLAAVETVAGREYRDLYEAWIGDE